MSADPRPYLNTNAKGARLERRTRDRLELVQYQVTRAGGSLGAWDLIAIGALDVLLVQVKANIWPGPLEREKMERFPQPPCVQKQIWRWDDRVREPRIKVLTPDGWVEM